MTGPKSVHQNDGSKIVNKKVLKTAKFPHTLPFSFGFVMAALS